MKAFCSRIVESRAFEPVMIGLILFNAVLIGLETSPAMLERHGDLLHLGNDIILWIFVAEALVKMIAVAPRLSLYFGNGEQMPEVRSDELTAAVLHSAITHHGTLIVRGLLDSE